CSGAVDVHIERLEDDAMTREWVGVLERAEAAVLVTPLGGTSGRLIVRSPGDPVGSLDDPAIEREAVAAARERLGAPFPHSGAESFGGAELFFHVCGPP